MRKGADVNGRGKALAGEVPGNVRRLLGLEVPSLMGACLALVLAASLAPLAGCGSSGSSGQDASSTMSEVAQEVERKVEESEDKTSDTSAEETAPAAKAEETETAAESGGYNSWAKECTDKWNTPTVYAISELKGWQYETLLQEKGYTWNREDSCWFDGNTGVMVCDKDVKPLDDQQIAKIDKGGVGSTVFYVINTRNYQTCNTAYLGLVSEVMVSEDSEFTEDLTAGFGVAYGPSMRRFLVELVSQDTGISLYIFPEETIKAGVFNSITGDNYGTSIDEVFESLIGRKPGSQH